MQRLHHAGLVSCLEWYRTQDAVYIAMEYFQEGDMMSYLLQRGALAESVARGSFLGILSAVHYLHSSNLAHRDLKPENMLVVTTYSQLPHLKICDFGLARLSSSVNDCKTVCGTPQYMAPEVIRLMKTLAGYDKRADMWSLGVTLFNLLSGENPFEECGLYANIVSASFDFEGDGWAGTSRCAKRLVRQLMEPNAEERFSAADAWHYADVVWRIEGRSKGD